MAPRPRPALMDDLIIDILLRLPPDDTACLARASLVCKAWRRLLADRAFLRRYREIHGAPPFLGFLYMQQLLRRRRSIRSPLPPHHTAVPISPAAGAVRRQPQLLPNPRLPPRPRPPSTPLTHGASPSGTLSPASSGASPHACTSTRKSNSRRRCSAAPPAAGCDHLDCGSCGRFDVVLVAKTDPDPDHYRWLSWHVHALTTARASHYSSETGKWTVSATIDLQSSFSIRIAAAPSLLAGDAIFFMLDFGKGIFKYDLTRGVLSVINLPPHYVPHMILCTAEDGGLGVAAMVGCSLRLFSGRSDPDGVTRWWVQGRVIELDSMIPTAVGDVFTNKFYVVGFAEGTGYIFVRMNDKIFSVELKSSGRISKIGTGKFGPIFPLMGFYIPDLASAKLQVPMRIE